MSSLSLFISRLLFPPPLRLMLRSSPRVRVRSSLSSSHSLVRKEETLDDALSGRKHCHEKKGIEGHGYFRHARPENLPRGQCHPQHPSMHMDNGPRCRNLSYLPTCFSRPCIQPLCPSCNHSMLCTDHPPPCLADP
jgi:hypothetical protein